jgi:hypothetical protein
VGISPLALFRSSDVKISIGDRDEREDLEDSKEDIMSNMTNIGDSHRRAGWYSPVRPPDGVDENDIITAYEGFRPNTIRKSTGIYVWGDKFGDHGKLDIDWSLKAHAKLTWKTRLLWEPAWYEPCLTQCSKWEVYDSSAFISEDYQDLQATLTIKNGGEASLNLERELERESEKGFAERERRRKKSKSFRIARKKIFSTVTKAGGSVDIYLISLDIGLIGSLYVGGDVSLSNQFDLTWKRHFRRSGMAVSIGMNDGYQYQLGSWERPTDQIDWGSKVTGNVELYLEVRISAGLITGFFGKKLEVGVEAYISFRLYME